MKRRAFTLIELMVVIAIIAILGSLLVIGIGKLETSVKRQHTRQTLLNCQALYAAWEASTRQVFSREPMACPTVVNADATAKDMNGNPVYAQFGRFGDAVIFTQDIMYHLNSMPANASALAQFPADTKTTLSQSLWTNNNSGGYVPVPAAQAATDIAYPQPLNHLWQVTDSLTPPTYYDCVQSYSAVPLFADQAYWLAAIPMVKTTVSPRMAYAPAVTVPIILDAWGNPIIFVPYQLGAGLSGALVNGVVPANSGELAAGGNPFQIKSPDERPFFASAGPDGDFSQGDDNLYSFEK